MVETFSEMKVNFVEKVEFVKNGGTKYVKRILYVD